jgi:hypothetical protein
MGPFGLRDVSVRAGEDHDGDPVIFVEAPEGEELIATARKLAKASPQKPRQADLKRAVSTAYYALFHALAKDAADMLVGVGPSRPDKAWTQTYRAL